MFYKSDILHNFSISSFWSLVFLSFWVFLEFFDFLEPDFDGLIFGKIDPKTILLFQKDQQPHK